MVRPGRMYVCRMVPAGVRFPRVLAVRPSAGGSVPVFPVRFGADVLTLPTPGGVPLFAGSVPQESL